jgi:hypothetical protein
MKIIETDWKDFLDNDTKALYLEKEGQYTISEFIELLQAAKEKFGDKEILIHDMNDGCLYGFSHIYFNKGNNEEDSAICIYA